MEKEKNNNQQLIRAQQPGFLQVLEQAALTKGAEEKQNAYLQLIKSVSQSTALQCLNGTQVSIMKRDDPAGLESKILEAINFVNETLNVGKKMSTFQAVDAATVIIKECWNLKIEEIVKAFNNGRMGLYGEIYRLDITTLMNWITAYCNTEQEQAIIENNNLKRLPPPEREIVSEEKLKDYREQFNKLMQQVQSKKIPEKKPVMNEVFFKESLRNNLPALNLEALNEWVKTFKKSGDKEFLKLVEAEIEHRKNRDNNA